MRRAGILLNISSLPNKYGIGGFGAEVEEFANFLKQSDVSLWQILPLTSIGQGNSPYSSVSAFAGNYLYIDPQRLLKDGLINQQEYNEAVFGGSPFTVDYAFATLSKRRLIKAIQNKHTLDNTLSNFLDTNKSWLDDYCAYMTIKELSELKPWWEWSDTLKVHDKIAVDNIISEHKDMYFYYVLEQYLFATQWRACKTHINQLGIKVVGDMPIYVSLDSCDVWAHTDLFQLDSDLKPKLVAGVPPDYFAKRGQLWGNPLYDYAVMAKDNYAWFTSRMARMFELYDICRFDHFRAVAEYWAVPYGAPDATCGTWVKGGGIEMMNAILRNNDGEIIAEDLGIIDNKVVNLRKASKLKGMRVLQFGFDGDDSLHLPHNYEQDLVAYTGTHDNNTLFGWLYEVPMSTKANLYDYIGAPKGLEGGNNSPQIWACIRAVLTSVAEYAIIPFQDLLGWGADTRMNIPGVAENNWRIRISSRNIAEVNVSNLKHMINISKRI